MGSLRACLQETLKPRSVEGDERRFELKYFKGFAYSKVRELVLGFYERNGYKLITERGELLLKGPENVATNAVYVRHLDEGIVLVEIRDLTEAESGA